MAGPRASSRREVRPQSMPWLAGCVWCEEPLAGQAGSSGAIAAQASEAVTVAKAAGGDGHSLGAEDVAHSSR